jgi:hypothetical protein
MKINNFLPDMAKNELSLNLLNDNFPWYYKDHTTQYLNNTQDDLAQFVHVFFEDGAINSQYFNIAKNIILFFEKETNIKIKNIIRLKANLNTKYKMTNKEMKQVIHKDSDSENFISLLYYVNDSDGDTLIYDNNLNLIESITPKENSLYWFKSNQFHAPTFPVKNKKRIVISAIIEV